MSEERAAGRSWQEISAEVAFNRTRAMGLAWYIIHAVGRSDRHAIDWLKQRGIETYYPMVREMRRIPKKEMSKKQRLSGMDFIRPRLVACFPRYMFVRFDMGKTGWREIFDYAGVGGMVCEGGLPVLVAEERIFGIKAQEVDGAVPGKTILKVIFNLGEELRVKDGPFASFNGIVEKGLDMAIEDIDADTRIRVAVNIFGRATPVDLHISQVEKL